MKIRILKLDTVDSTNTEALKHARNGADEGLCIIARQQTAGRGRLGRTWVSEKDAGLYFSIVLRPKIEQAFFPLITLAAGIAVFDTLVSYGLEPDIKWVNDVMVGEKKISGILAETTESNFGSAVVLGIGINLNSANFPQELTDSATSLESEGVRIDLNELVKNLSGQIASRYELIHSSAGRREIIEEWKNRSTYFEGKHVRVKMGGEEIVGVTAGLEPNGALRLSVNGHERIIHTGDVENLRVSKSL